MSHSTNYQPQTGTPVMVQSPNSGPWQPKPATSGLRVGAGVVALCLAAWGILLVLIKLFSHHSGASTPFHGWMNFILIVGTVGCLVTGIVILAKQRKRGGSTPWLVAGFAALAMIGSIGPLASRDGGTPGGDMIMIPLAAGTLILAALVILRDKIRR